MFLRPAANQKSMTRVHCYLLDNLSFLGSDWASSYTMNEIKHKIIFFRINHIINQAKRFG